MAKMPDSLIEDVVRKAVHTYYDEIFRKGKETGRPKWISVEERLPDESETVLVYCDGCCGVARLLDVEPITMWTYTGFGGDPTHWMPLPEPPADP